MTSRSSQYSTADAGSVSNSSRKSSSKKKKPFKRMFGMLTGESKKDRGSRSRSSRSGGSSTRGSTANNNNNRASTMSRASTRSGASYGGGGDDYSSYYDEDSTIYNVDVEERSVKTAGSAREMLNELETASQSSRGSRASRASRTSRKGQSSKNRDRSTPTNGSSSRTNGASPSSGGAAAAGGATPSSAASSSSKKSKSYMLKVVLLLMDPRTRRFELLQLEFDSLKALVSDVLIQIPISATEEALRHQSYVGICGYDGKQMPSEYLLSTLCKGNEVLVAIPYGEQGTNVARLARPILNDPKVVSMLVASGITVDGWKDDGKKKVRKSSSKKTAGHSSSSARSREIGSSSASSAASSKNKAVLFGIFILLAIGLQVYHLFISAPIKPNHVVAPGIWLSKCGLLAFLPSCDNEYLTMDEQGNLSLYDSKKELAWQIQGQVCNDNDASCIPGMQVKEDGSLVVGGKPISQVNMYKEKTYLSPWPFAEKPDIEPVLVGEQVADEEEQVVERPVLVE